MKIEGQQVRQNQTKEKKISKIIEPKIIVKPRIEKEKSQDCEIFVEDKGFVILNFQQQLPKKSQFSQISFKAHQQSNEQNFQYLRFALTIGQKNENALFVQKPSGESLPNQLHNYADINLLNKQDLKKFYYVICLINLKELLQFTYKSLIQKAYIIMLQYFNKYKPQFGLNQESIKLCHRKMSKTYGNVTNIISNIKSNLHLPEEIYNEESSKFQTYFPQVKQIINYYFSREQNQIDSEHPNNQMQTLTGIIPTNNLIKSKKAGQKLSDEWTREEFIKYVVFLQEHKQSIAGSVSLIHQCADFALNGNYKKLTKKRHDGLNKQNGVERTISKLTHQWKISPDELYQEKQKLVIFKTEKNKDRLKIFSQPSEFDEFLNELQFTPIKRDIGLKVGKGMRLVANKVSYSILAPEKGNEKYEKLQKFKQGRKIYFALTKANFENQNKKIFDLWAQNIMQDSINDEFIDFLETQQNYCRTDRQFNEQKSLLLFKKNQNPVELDLLYCSHNLIKQNEKVTDKVESQQQIFPNLSDVMPPIQNFSSTASKQFAVMGRQQNVQSSSNNYIQSDLNVRIPDKTTKKQKISKLKKRIKRKSKDFHRKQIEVNHPTMNFQKQTEMSFFNQDFLLRELDEDFCPLNKKILEYRILRKVRKQKAALPTKKEKFNHWLQDENLRFLGFLLINRKAFQNLIRPPNFTFNIMTEIVATKNPQQCQSHFHKIKQPFKTIQEIIKGLQIKYNISENELIDQVKRQNKIKTSSWVIEMKKKPFIKKRKSTDKPISLIKKALQENKSTFCLFI